MDTPVDHTDITLVVNTDIPPDRSYIGPTDITPDRSSFGHY